MKVQMLLSFAILGALLGGVASLPFLSPDRQISRVVAFVPAMLFGLTFIATTIPFLLKAWPKDRMVAVISPMLLFGRAVALMTGYIQGNLFPCMMPTMRAETGA